MAATGIHLRLLYDGCGTIRKFPKRELPGLVHLCQQGSPCFAVGSVRIFLAGHIDFFHQAAGSDVVFINIERLFTPFEGDVVASGCVVAIALLNEALDLLGICNMARSDGASIHKSLWIHKLGTEILSWAVIGIVALLQNHFDNRAGIRITPFGNPLTGKEHSSIAEATQRLPTRFGRSIATLRQRIHRTLEKRIGRLIVFIIQLRLTFFHQIVAVTQFLLEHLDVRFHGSLNARVLRLESKRNEGNKKKSREPEWKFGHFRSGR